MSIKVITSRDINSFKEISKVGFIREEHLKENLNQRHTRIRNLVKGGYLKKETYFEKGGREKSTAYSLTEKSKLEVCNKTGIDKSSMYKETSANHDLKLADKYFSLCEEEKKTWMTESEIREKYQLYGSEYSVPDASYVRLNSGDIVAVESITCNYKSEDIEAKIETSSSFASSCELLK